MSHHRFILLLAALLVGHCSRDKQTAAVVDCLAGDCSRNTGGDSSIASGDGPAGDSGRGDPNLTGGDCAGSACGCPSGTRVCGDQCIPESHCCISEDCPRAGEVCTDGVCDCPPGQNLCDGVCAVTTGCCDDIDCGLDGVCTAGQCSCPTGRLCDDICIAVDDCCLSSECELDEECVAGQCVCTTGLRRCEQACIPVDDCCIDEDCDRFWECVSGACQCPGGGTDETCDDSIDNDCDGLTDCEDTTTCPAGTSCDGSCSECQVGECQPVAAGQSRPGCNAAATDCSGADTCDGAGGCDRAHLAAGAEGGCPRCQDCDGLGNCADVDGEQDVGCAGPQTACSNPDQCVQGSCQRNHRPSGDEGYPSMECAACRDCNGSGQCADLDGTSDVGCDGGQTACSNPDTCVSGACQRNHRAAGDEGYPSMACGVCQDCSGTGQCADVDGEADVGCELYGQQCTTGTCGCPLGGVEDDASRCGDSLDNDCDGYTDCNDSNCQCVGACFPGDPNFQTFGPADGASFCSTYSVSLDPNLGVGGSYSVTVWKQSDPSQSETCGSVTDTFWCPMSTAMHAAGETYLWQASWEDYCGITHDGPIWSFTWLGCCACDCGAPAGPCNESTYCCGGKTCQYQGSWGCY